jgi:uncharacterized protein (TIGR02246 family)
VDDRRIDDLEAYEEIRRLAADYAHGFDKRDLDLFLSVWGDDASWTTMPEGEPSVGRDAIRATCEATWQAVGDTHHWMANHSIRVDGDTATGTLDADCEVTDPDGTWFRVAATYADTYGREGGTWRITGRTTQIHHYLPMAGG